MRPARPDGCSPCSGPIHRTPLATVAHRSQPPEVARKWHDARSTFRRRHRAASLDRPMASLQRRGVPVELEPDVTAWLDNLADDEFGHVERYIEVRFTTATASGPLQPSQGGVVGRLV